MSSNRRAFIASSLASLAALAPLPALSAPRDSVGKKGWAGGKDKLPEKFRAHWYYNWMVTEGDVDLPFVPLFKTGEAVNAKNIAAVRNIRGLDAILGFNEPEREKQGNLSVDDAIRLWPTLSNLAEREKVRLGSPACSSDSKGMDWFQEFMEKAKKEDLKIDFIAVHWYRSRNAKKFEDFIEDLSKQYGRRKVWITEFNGWSGTEKENYDFLKDSLKFMERNDLVERYAYFEPGAGKPQSLLNPDGSLTRMGQLYQETEV